MDPPDRWGVQQELFEAFCGSSDTPLQMSCEDFVEVRWQDVGVCHTLAGRCVSRGRCCSGVTCDDRVGCAVLRLRRAD